MIGADIVDIRRIKDAVSNEHFVKRIFTQNEISYAETKRDKFSTFAGIYAAKEAVAKLSGRGFKGFSPCDIEIVHDVSGAPKVKLYKGAENLFNGELFVSISHDGGFAFAVASYDPIEFNAVLPGKTIEDGDLSLIKRKRNSHKGDYGRLFIIGGNSLMIGAPLITAQAAVKAGAGLTTLCVADSLLYAYRPRVKEIMLKGMPDKAGAIVFDPIVMEDICSKADCIIMGMGMGKNESMRDIIKYAFENFNGILVCDADAINALSANPELLFSDRKCSLVLTPHVGEYKRLLGGVRKCADCDDDVAVLAKTINAVVACKGSYTVISDGITDYNVVSGTAAMAKGGSGDALAGIIGAYSCRTTLVEAAALACHLFGRCGEKAESLKGENAVTATDIINCL